MIHSRTLPLLLFFLTVISPAQQQRSSSYESLHSSLAQMSQQQRQKFIGNMDRQSREAYQKYQLELRQKEKEQEAELERLRADIEERTDPNERIIIDESSLVYSQMENYNYDEFQHQGHDLAFILLPGQSADFKITPTHQHTLLIYARVFQNVNAAYLPITSANQAQVMWLYVFDDSLRMISQGSFYSMGFQAVKVKANLTYMLRFLNQGEGKLVTFQLPHLVESSHVENTVTVEDVAGHSQRIEKLVREFKQKRQDLQLAFGLEMINSRQLASAFSQYCWYSVAEGVVLLVIMLIQVEAIRKLLLAHTVV